MIFESTQARWQSRRLDRENYQLQTWNLTAWATQDPRLVSVVRHDLTRGSYRVPDTDTEQAAATLADIAEKYELDPDDMQRAIEYCRRALSDELQQSTAFTYLGIYG